MQAQFQSPPPGPRKGFAFSSDFKNRIGPNQNSTICAQGPNWAWLKDVTPAYLFEVAFYKFWRQRATAIAKMPDGAVKPCWHDESITGTWCSLANLLNCNSFDLHGFRVYFLSRHRFDLLLNTAKAKYFNPKS